MRVQLKELLDKLAVGYILSAYETCPWSAYDDEKGITCSAEVRMNSDGDEIEAELQMMYENPEDGQQPLEQVFWLLAQPAVGGTWDVKGVKIRGKENEEGLYAYEEKAVDFFHACVSELKMDKIPDIDALLAQHVKKSERYGGNSQGGGNKSPKIKPAAVMGIKSGM